MKYRYFSKSAVRRRNLSSRSYAGDSSIRRISLYQIRHATCDGFRNRTVRKVRIRFKGQKGPEGPKRQKCLNARWYFGFARDRHTSNGTPSLKLRTERI